MLPMPAYVPDLLACVYQVSQKYSLPPRGLIALWLTEWGRQGTQSKNKNGTIDHGLLQINTVWLKRLTKIFGLTANMLTHYFCFSVRAGYYIL